LNWVFDPLIGTAVVLAFALFCVFVCLTPAPPQIAQIRQPNNKKGGPVSKQ
jgi:hypothetical protein